MIVSLLLAWVAFFLFVMEVLRVVARLSKNKALNRFFHKIHIPFGSLLLTVGLLHGIIAGNVPETPLLKADIASVLFTFNWGTAAFLCAVLLGGTYLLRKRLKKKWMTVHRVLTVVMAACLVFHIVSVGIQLPGRLLHKKPADEIYVDETASDTVLSPTETAAAETDTVVSMVSETVETTESDTEILTEALTEDITEAVAVLFSGAVLADGNYEGSARGRNGDVYVRVTVEDGSVADIQVIRHSETEKFFARAINVIGDIIGLQSLCVDAVTGATLSSNAIKNAAYDALQDAVVSGELQKNQAY